MFLKEETCKMPADNV